MFCKYCGTQSTGAGFCASCGKSVPVPSSTTPRATPSPASPQTTREPAAVSSQPQPAARPGYQTTPNQTPASTPPRKTTRAAHSRRARSRLRLAGILMAGFVFLGATGGSIWWLLDSNSDPAAEASQSANSYGSDAQLDALWDRCEAGSLDACDELYFAAPVGSGYEEYGATCGERDGSAGLCQTDITDQPISDKSGFGSDPTLDLLWLECEEGNMFACDDLFFEATPGSGYEQFGAACGNRGEGNGDCISQF